MLYDACRHKAFHLLAFKAVLLQNLPGVLSDTRVPLQTGVGGGTGQNGSRTGALVLSATPDERPPLLVVGMGAHLVEGQHGRDAGVRSVEDLRPLRLGFGGETTLEHAPELRPSVRAHLRGQVCGVQSQAWEETIHSEDVRCQRQAFKKIYDEEEACLQYISYIYSHLKKT